MRDGCESDPAEAEIVVGGFGVEAERPRKVFLFAVQAAATGQAAFFHANPVEPIEGGAGVEVGDLVAVDLLPSGLAFEPPAIAEFDATSDRRGLAVHRHDFAGVHGDLAVEKVTAGQGGGECKRVAAGAFGFEEKINDGGIVPGGLPAELAAEEVAADAGEGVVVEGNVGDGLVGAFAGDVQAGGEFSGEDDEIFGEAAAVSGEVTELGEEESLVEKLWGIGFESEFPALGGGAGAEEGRAAGDGQAAGIPCGRAECPQGIGRARNTAADDLERGVRAGADRGRAFLGEAAKGKYRAGRAAGLDVWFEAQKMFEAASAGEGEVGI